MQKQFEYRGERARVFETTDADRERFARMIGPIGKEVASRIRWQLLEAVFGADEPRITLGMDITGEPRPE